VSAVLRKIERTHWRRRAQAMDRVYLYLCDNGLTTAAHLAGALEMREDYVAELLEDLHLDSIVGKAADLYYATADDYVRIQ
jgi:hypothetical protein